MVEVLKTNKKAIIYQDPYYESVISHPPEGWGTSIKIAFIDPRSSDKPKELLDIKDTQETVVHELKHAADNTSQDARNEKIQYYKSNKSINLFNKVDL